MKVASDRMELITPITFGEAWVRINVLSCDYVFFLTVDELKELSQLTESLLQELKGEENADSR